MDTAPKRGSRQNQIRHRYTTASKKATCLNWDDTRTREERLDVEYKSSPVKGLETRPCDQVKTGGRAARSFSPCVRSPGAAPPSPLIAASLAYRAALVSRASRHVLSPSCARVRARVTSRQPLVVVPDHGARVRRTRLLAPPHVVKVGSTLSINFYRLTR